MKTDLFFECKLSMEDMHILMSKDDNTIEGIFDSIDKEKFKRVLTNSFKDYLDERLDDLINYYRLHTILHERSKNKVYILSAKLNKQMNSEAEDLFYNYLEQILGIRFHTINEHDYEEEFNETFFKINNGLEELVRIAFSAYVDSIIDSQLSYEEDEETTDENDEVSE